MGLGTNRVLMDQPLLALFISTKRHGSGPAPRGSAPSDKGKERAARLYPLVAQAAAACRAEHVRPVPVSRINLFDYSRALSRRRRTLKCDEQVFVSSYFR